MILKLSDLLLEILVKHLEILTVKLEGLKIEDYERGFEDGERAEANRIYHQLGLDKPYPDR